MQSGPTVPEAQSHSKLELQKVPDKSRNQPPASDSGACDLKILQRRVGKRLPRLEDRDQNEGSDSSSETDVEFWWKATEFLNLICLVFALPVYSTQVSYLFVCLFKMLVTESLEVRCLHSRQGFLGLIPALQIKE